MTRDEIYAAIDEIKKALEPSHPDAATVARKLTDETKEDYIKICRRHFPIDENGKFEWPIDASVIIEGVQSASNREATLHKYATALRYLAMKVLNEYRLKIDQAQRQRDWNKVEKMLKNPRLNEIKTLAKTLPEEYKVGWEPSSKRSGKKSSLNKMAADWREQIAVASGGQFRLPTLVAIMTGCRPAELEKGISLTLINNQVIAHIPGAKVTDNSGQPERTFTLADHPVTDQIIEEINKQTCEGYITVKVKHGNSVTTHIRNLAIKLWPKRKSKITVYSLRHAMAADCKYAIKHYGADKDLVSKVLGHFVDETQTYYGSSSQAKGRSVVPSAVTTPRPIKQKATKRNRNINQLKQKTKKVN